MKLGQRLARLEGQRGGAVRIAHWCAFDGQPYEPSEGLRQHIEEQVALLGPERCEWQHAVFVAEDDAHPFIVLVGGTERDSTLQVVELP